MREKRSNTDWRIQAAQRYKAWQDLLDFSTELALAGIRSQGFSAGRAWKIWCERWKKASQQHQKVNRKVIRLLHARDRVFKSEH